ncbi:MAG: hypothetical protein WCP55_12145, partial [Lentisphaerota bacterium]
MGINVKKIVYAVLLSMGTSTASVAETGFDLGIYLKKELDVSTKFDRNKAQVEACDELKIKTSPTVPKDKKDIEKDAAGKANQLTEEKFPESLKKKIQQDADDKFKAVKVGDQVTVPYRSGSGFLDYTGEYKGISVGGGKLIVGEKQILKSDLNPDILDKFDENKVREKQTDYLRTAYTIPRNKYINDARKSIIEQYEKDKAVYEKFQKVVTDKEREF